MSRVPRFDLERPWSTGSSPPPKHSQTTGQVRQVETSFIQKNWKCQPSCWWEIVAINEPDIFLSRKLIFQIFFGHFWAGGQKTKAAGGGEGGGGGQQVGPLGSLKATHQTITKQKMTDNEPIIARTVMRDARAHFSPRPPNIQISDNFHRKLENGLQRVQLTSSPLPNP